LRGLRRELALRECAHCVANVSLELA